MDDLTAKKDMDFEEMNAADARFIRGMLLVAAAIVGAAFLIVGWHLMG